jgi:hypothetical protein
VNYPSAPVATTTLHFWVRDYLGGNVPEASVSACGHADTNCSQVIASGTTNSTGEVLLPLGLVQGIAGPLGNGLTGFLQVTAPTYVPYYYDWGYPLSEPGVFLYGEVVTVSEFQTIANNLHITLDPSRGHLSVAPYDCLGNGGPGVRVTLDTADQETQSVTSSTGVATDITDSQGLLFFFNVPVGTVKVTATPEAIAPRTSSIVTTTIYKGAITSVLAYPTPARP